MYSNSYVLETKNTTEEKSTQVPEPSEDKSIQILANHTAENTEMTEDNGSHTPKTYKKERDRGKKYSGSING